MINFILYLAAGLLITQKNFLTNLRTPNRVEITSLYLNRIFANFEECHIKDGSLYLYLNSSDYRASHIRKVLKLQEGDSLKIGVVDVGLSDFGQVIESNKQNVLLDLGSITSFVMNKPPLVDLILAVPRPLRLERLLPVISSMGVGTIVLIGASKVEKAFFGSHLFREPEQMKAALIEGLSQAKVDCLLPRVIVRRDLQSFLENDLNVLFPPSEYRRVIAHPLQEKSTLDGMGIPTTTRLSAIDTIPSESKSYERIVVAVGPEGGWEDREVAAFVKGGFDQIHLGSRVLRTDVAVTALLALAHEWVARQQES